MSKPQTNVSITMPVVRPEAQRQTSLNTTFMAGALNVTSHKHEEILKSLPETPTILYSSSEKAPTVTAGHEWREEREEEQESTSGESAFM